LAEEIHAHQITKANFEINRVLLRDSVVSMKTEH